MNQEINVDDLYSQPFSIARHKMVPYLELEVIISPKGEIEYGDDFYIIDMARAAESALLKCVPKNLLKPNKEDWLAKLPSLFESEN